MFFFTGSMFKECSTTLLDDHPSLGSQPCQCSRNKINYQLSIRISDTTGGFLKCDDSPISCHIYIIYVDPPFYLPLNPRTFLWGTRSLRGCFIKRVKNSFDKIVKKSAKTKRGWHTKESMERILHWFK